MRARQHSILHTQLNYLTNSTMEQQVEFMTTKRGASSLVINRYQYTLNQRGREGQSYWSSNNRLCKGRAVTSEEDELISVNNLHGHVQLMSSFVKADYKLALVQSLQISFPHFKDVIHFLH